MQQLAATIGEGKKTKRSWLKILLLVLVLLVILLVVIGALALTNFNSLVNMYKPKLEETLSRQLGAKVVLGELQTHIFPTTKIEIKELKNFIYYNYITRTFNLDFNPIINTNINNLVNI